jgi:hypothetical protein
MQSVCCMLTLPRRVGTILGADLNRSELSRLLISQDFLPKSGTTKHLRDALGNKRFSQTSGTTEQTARALVFAPATEVLVLR